MGKLSKLFIIDNENKLVFGTVYTGCSLIKLYANIQGCKLTIQKIMIGCYMNYGPKIFVLKF